MASHACHTTASRPGSFSGLSCARAAIVASPPQVWAGRACGTSNAITVGSHMGSPAETFTVRLPAVRGVACSLGHLVSTVSTVRASGRSSSRAACRRSPKPCLRHFGQVTDSDGGTVLVLTHRLDPTADLVVHHLNTRGVPVFRCDTAEFPMELTLSATLGTAGTGRSTRGAEPCRACGSTTPPAAWTPTTSHGNSPDSAPR
ncbi:MvdC/MvdD family ATP grasp protein [Streptomyces sp. NPDC058694]|uniref:MvdC/MvdD family ATP grasp protein n=1 Tax=Streptomyces sp. NPDC058694 TaxID=3346603 RepID=UPI003667127D